MNLASIKGRRPPRAGPDGYSPTEHDSDAWQGKPQVQSHRRSVCSSSPGARQALRVDHTCGGSKLWSAEPFYDTERELKGEGWSKILPGNLCLVI